MRFHRVRIHDAEDPQYKAYLTALLAVKSNQKASRPPSNLSLFGGEAEVIVRDWLQTIHPLTDTRFVEYDERVGSALNRKYRELDAVQRVDATHIHVYEVKASRSARALTKGLRQLQESKTILQRIIPHVRCTLVLVDTGIPTAAEVAALMATPEAPFRPPMTVADVAAAHPDISFVDAATYDGSGGALTVVLLPLAAVIAHGEALGMALHLDWDEPDEDLEDDQEPPQAVQYTSHDAESEADDDNPFAAAFRKANEQPKR